MLEYDALQVLSLIRSMKNTFALVNKTPPEVLSLIPDYWEDSDKDRALIGSTHVCRHWREIFVSRPSLWTTLDCKHVEKTGAYIERSKASPLEIHLDGHGVTHFCEEAFLLAVPHIGRLKTLSAFGWKPPVSAAFLQVLVEHFCRPAPLLKKLKIDLSRDPVPTLPGTLFRGNFPSLCELRLTGIIMPLSWRGLGNLTNFHLSDVPEHEIILAHLLDFFESAPHLHDIQLLRSVPGSSNVPPERIVSLPNLRELGITSCPASSILLDHLSIPSGATVVLGFTFYGTSSPIPPRIPENLGNLHNLSHITVMNLCFGPEQRAIQLNGPSGALYVRGKWVCEGARPHTGTTRLLRFLNRFDTSRCRWLGITKFISHPDPSTPITACATYQLLLSKGDLHTLTLIESNNRPFIYTLNPGKNPKKAVLCPKLEGIILYIKPPHKFYVDELLSMAEERASRGARLSTTTVVSMDALAPSMEIFQLRKHVSRVECKFDNAPPAWDTVPE